MDAASVPDTGLVWFFVSARGNYQSSHVGAVHARNDYSLKIISTRRRRRGGRGAGRGGGRGGSRGVARILIASARTCCSDLRNKTMRLKGRKPYSVMNDALFCACKSTLNAAHFYVSKGHLKKWVGARTSKFLGHRLPAAGYGCRPLRSVFLLFVSSLMALKIEVVTDILKLGIACILVMMINNTTNAKH